MSPEQITEIEKAMEEGEHEIVLAGVPALIASAKREKELERELAAAQAEAKNALPRVDFDGQTVFGTYYGDGTP